jgi:hypothetical protein
MVPAKTVSPTLLVTAILSPVIAAWLTDDIPLVTVPSNGILSPGLTITISSVFTAWAWTLMFLPSLFTRAVSGASLTRAPIEFLALSLA